MNFELSEEQQLIQDSVARFVQDNYDSRRVRSSPAQARIQLRALADDGGARLAGADRCGERRRLRRRPDRRMLIMEQFGKGLVLEPYLAHVVMGARRLMRSGSDAQRSQFLPRRDRARFRQLRLRLTPRNRRGSTCTTSPRGPAPTATTSCSTAPRSWFANAATADSHRGIQPAPRVVRSTTDGISLFLVDARAKASPRQASRRWTACRPSEVDARRTSRVASSDCSVPRARATGRSSTSPTMHPGASAAEAVGAMEVLYKDTVAYTQEREQFDHPWPISRCCSTAWWTCSWNTSSAKSLLYRATIEVAQSRSRRTSHRARPEAFHRQDRHLHCGERRAAARRHGYDRGATRGSLLQTLAGDRCAVRQR